MLNFCLTSIFFLQSNNRNNIMLNFCLTSIFSHKATTETILCLIFVWPAFFSHKATTETILCLIFVWPAFFWNYKTPPNFVLGRPVAVGGKCRPIRQYPSMPQRTAYLISTHMYAKTPLEIWHVSPQHLPRPRKQLSRTVTLLPGLH